MANGTGATGPKPSNERLRELIAHPDVAMLHEISRLAQSEIDNRSAHLLNDEVIRAQQQEINRLRRQLESDSTVSLQAPATDEARQ